MVLLGQDSIRDVLLFPTMRRKDDTADPAEGPQDAPVEAQS